MENDTRIVAEHLRRMAPAQTHENRRTFQQAAGMLQGADVEPRPTEFGPMGNVLFAIPVNQGDKHLGWIEIHFDTPASEGEIPIVSVDWLGSGEETRERLYTPPQI